MYALYEDQIKAVSEVISYFTKGFKSVLLYAPTASGKTVMGSDIVYKMAMKAIFLVNRQTLVSQSYDKLKEHGLKVAVFHGTITENIDGVKMNDDWRNADVIVSLVETYQNGIASGELVFDPKLIVIDECHKGTSEGYQEFRDQYPDALIVGLTATPGRHQNKEGESLCEWYQAYVQGDTIMNLINKGRLARPEYKFFTDQDHVVDAWNMLTSLDTNRRTIIFAQDARHMINLKKAFNDNGIDAEYISSGSEQEDIKDEIVVQTSKQRNAIFRRFREGTLNVLISFGVLCEGFDEPLAKYCFLLRKVSHVSILHQMAGRVLRIAEEKSDAVICDFYGNLEEYGPIEEYKWEIDGGGSKDNVLVKDGTVIYMGHFQRKPKIFVYCAECSHVYDVAKFDDCPCCSRRNVVKVTATFAQMRDFFIARIPADKWANFCKGKFIKKGEEFWTFFTIVERALVGKQTMRFNDMYFDLFEDGKFMKEYNWMEPLIGQKNKLKYDSRVEFVL